jgi:Origin recognition complex (ORC) subunit 3 N-terminus
VPQAGSNLPVVLLLCTSTSSEELLDTLPGKALRALRVSAFQLPTALQRMEAVADQVRGERVAQGFDALGLQKP